MKTLYYANPPYDVERLKDATPEKVHVSGARVYHAEFFAALVRYSSFDRIVVPAESPRRDENRARVLYVPERELAPVLSADALTLVTPGITLFNPVRVRRLIGRTQAPCTGIVHSLGSPAHPLVALSVLLSGLLPWDALVCSSVAGRTALQAGFGLIWEALGNYGHLPASHPAIRMPLIPLGIDADAFAPDTQVEACDRDFGPGPVILYFGRLSRLSKVDLTPLFVAFAEIERRHASATLVVAGDDTQEHVADELDRIASALHCRNVRIVPNPSSAKKHGLYRAATVFVALSDNVQETFGITIVEAMSAGLPVIASDWSGYKELVIDGVTGFLIPTVLPVYTGYFDDLRGHGAPSGVDILSLTTITDVQLLIQAIERVIAAPDLGRRLGSAAIRRARQLYDWRVVIAQYEELWGELAAIAAASAIPVAPLDINRLPYREIFAHYPTVLASDDVRLRVTDRGLGWKEQNRELLACLCCPTNWFSERVMRMLLDAIEACPGCGAGELVRRFSTHPSEDVVYLSHLYRLWKVGWIEPA